ncbi:hypothetical protein [Effusibacillus dendaii]|nr:hypothetical protein [Effusibacillus dendaii]
MKEVRNDGKQLVVDIGNGNQVQDMWNTILDSVTNRADGTDSK